MLTYYVQSGTFDRLAERAKRLWCSSRTPCADNATIPP